MSTNIDIKIQAKTEGAAEVKKLERELSALGKIESFKKLKSDIQESRKAWKDAESEVAKLAKEMRATDKPTQALVRNFEAAKKKTSKLKTAFQQKQQALQKLRGSLTAAGIDTAKLGAEQKKLQQALSKTRQEVSKAAKINAARGLLDVRPFKDIRREIKQTEAAYLRLKQSGKLSATELYQAEVQLKNKTRELKAETNSWAAALANARAGLVTVAAAGYAVVKSFGSYSEFSQRMAEVNTLLDVSGERFAALSNEILSLSTEIPQTASELAAAEYDIVSAGVALEKSTSALEKSAKAAVAGVTDTKTAVNAGVGVINAYGKSIDELDDVYDILFQTVKSGVTTFPELAQNIGDVLPSARSAGVDFKDVAASIAAMTKAGIKTPQAATALKGAINAMAAPTPEAKKKFDELEITWEGLLPTLEAIRKKSLSVDQMRLLIPDVEARTGVLALTQNMDGLKKIMDGMINSAGSMQAAFDKMKDTPENQIKLFKNEISRLGIEMGGLMAKILLPTVKGIRGFTNAVQEADPVTKTLISTMIGVGAAFTLWKLGLAQLALGLKGLIIQAAAFSVTPLGAAIVGVTAAVVGLTYVWQKFNQSQQDAADAIQKSRDAVDNEIKTLEKLKKQLAETKEGTREHTEAEEKLAKILPDATLMIDEHGRVLARVGKEHEENTRKLDKYLSTLKQNSKNLLVEQLEIQARAFKEADEKLQKYKENLGDWYGLFESDESYKDMTLVDKATTKFWRTVNKLTGTYDKNIAKGAQYRTGLKETEQSYNNLLIEAHKLGLEEEELGKLLERIGASGEIEEKILASYRQLREEIKKTVDTSKDNLDTNEDKQDTASSREAEEERKQRARDQKQLEKQLADELIEISGDKWAVLRNQAKKHYEDQEALAHGHKELLAKAEMVYTSKLKQINAAREKELSQSIVKSQTTRLEATTKTALVILENTYKDGEIALQEYFAQRKKLIEKQFKAEIASMQALADAEPDPIKKQEIEDQIFEKEQAHRRAMIELARQQKTAEEALLEQRKQAAEILHNIKNRTGQPIGTGLGAEFATELAEMDARHAVELDRLRKLNAEKEKIDEAYRLQKMEKEQLMVDQERRLHEYRLNIASDLAGGLSDIFQSMYELTGEKQKEFFYLAKAAALAEAIINTHQAVTKALAQGGIWGTVKAAAVMASGMAQVAKIQAQTLAAGGPILGHSPHDKADNVPIWATAGEFMQPVSAVEYYGKDIMEAIRRKMIPKDLLSGFSIPLPAMRPSYALASGGSVPQTPAAGFSVTVPVSISAVADADRIARILPGEIEQTVIRIMRQEMR